VGPRTYLGVLAYIKIIFPCQKTNPKLTVAQAAMSYSASCKKYEKDDKKELLIFHSSYFYSRKYTPFKLFSFLVAWLLGLNRQNYVATQVRN
jgi:hypothetical protein